jgi:hypothetical protein
MLIIHKHSRRQWIRLIEEILTESRKGSKLAQAWFQKDPWLTVSKELWSDEKTIAEVVRLSLASDKDKEDELEEPIKVTRRPTYSPEELKDKQLASKRAYYHRKKEELAKQKAIPTLVWPTSYREISNDIQTA